MSETLQFVAISGRGIHSGKQRSFDGRAAFCRLAGRARPDVCSKLSQISGWRAAGWGDCARAGREIPDLRALLSNFFQWVAVCLAGAAGGRDRRLIGRRGWCCEGEHRNVPHFEPQLDAEPLSFFAEPLEDLLDLGDFHFLDLDVDRAAGAGLADVC